MAKAETYQVWHDNGWPQSRINQTLGGWPASQFPEAYSLVATVKAVSHKQVVDLTTDKGSILNNTSIPWETNPDVQSFSPYQRDTTNGDVIVAPSGQPYRVEGESFEEVKTHDWSLNEAAKRGNDKPKDRER